MERLLWQQLHLIQLKFANKLKSAGVLPEHAEAEAEALADIFEVNLKEVATKEDIEAS